MRMVHVPEKIKMLLTMRIFEFNDSHTKGFRRTKTNQKILPSPGRYLGMRRILAIICLLLLFPALFINLGLMTFIDDEAIRSLVALEMDLRGNYIMPTLNQEAYFNKPPLFNWLLLGYFYLLGNLTELTARSANVISLLAYAGVIFLSTRPFLGNKRALLNAFFLITCGRILFWDSMLGLIDITFSLVIFSSFMVVFYAFQKKLWYTLFLLTYFLTAVGFLMKGLPALVFQAFTLLTWFIAQKEWRRLFSLAHLTGILVLASILGLYYYAYFQYVPIEEVTNTLLTESSKRTAVNYGIGPTIQHLFTFPLEMTYHFLPWSLMVLYFFRKKSLQLIWKHPFLKFCILVFLSNLILYWTSVEVYPRYLLMHAPLLFTVFLALHRQHLENNTWHFRVVMALLFMICLFFFGLSFVPFLPEMVDDVPHKLVKTSFLLGATLSLLLVFAMRKTVRIFATIGMLLLARIGFDWFVLPDRYQEDWGTMVQTSSIEVGESLMDIEDLYIYKASSCQATNSYYITRTRKQLLPRKYEGFEVGDYMIIDQEMYPKARLEEVQELYIRYGKKSISVGRYMGHE